MKMLQSTLSAKNVFPVAGVFGDVVVSRRGALTLGWEVAWPEAFSCDEDDYDEIAAAFAAAIKALPPWSVIHRQDIYTYEDYVPEGEASRRGFLGRSYDRYFDGRRYLVHRSYIFLTMAPRALVDKNGSSSGLFGIGGSVSVPRQDDVAAFMNKCNDFASIAATGGLLRLRQLERKDWLGEDEEVGIIQRYMMLGDGSPVMSDIKMTPSTVSVYDKVMQAYAVGESDLLPGTLASVTKMGNLSTMSSEVWLSFGSRLGITLPCEHVVNQIFVIPHQDETLRALEKEKNKMMSGLKSVDNRVNGGEIAQFLEDQYATRMFLVRAHLNILAWDTEENQTHLSGMLSTALKQMGITATYNNHNTPVLYYAGIPSNAYEIGRENLMTMELNTALCLPPAETFDRGIEDGPVRLCDRLRHVPVNIDFQHKAQARGFIDNYNIFVLGGSGSGKSFCTNKLVNDLYEAGEAVFIIDVGDSYEAQARIHYEESGGRDGVYLSWDDDHPLTFDVFAGADEWLGDDGTLHSDEEGGNFFLTLVQTICEMKGGWTTERKNILTQTIVEFLQLCRKEERRPTFDGYFRFFDKTVLPKITYVSSWETAKASIEDETSAQRLTALKEDDYRAHGYWIGNVQVRPEVFDAASFALALKEYSASGARARLLNDPNPKDIFSSDFTVIEVDRLSQDDPKYYSVCILCIMHALDVKMRKDTSKFKTFVIEEAWKAISNETMAPYLRGLWKTSRKFNTSACVVTQEVVDIVDNPTIKTAIVDNSSVKILLDQSNHMKSFGKIRDLLSLTDKDVSLILSVNRDNDPDLPLYKEVYINLGGKKAGVYATEVSPEQALAYESNKNKKESLFELAWEKGSMKEAIEETVKKRKLS